MPRPIMPQRIMPGPISSPGTGPKPPGPGPTDCAAAGDPERIVARNIAVKVAAYCAFEMIIVIPPHSAFNNVEPIAPPAS